MTAPQPFGRAILPAFLLEPDAAHLNHGSFGATPHEVLAVQDQWRRRLEAQPSRFMMRELEPALAAAREPLARLVGVDAQGLAFVDNATSGVNAVARSLDLQPGDEVLTTDHVYGAVRQTFTHVCARAGARLIEARLPFPPAASAELEAALMARISARTRLVAIDHVTSPSAMILPVSAIAAACRSRGIPVLVDGAHAPGMLDLAIGALGVDWYTGNCHKWLCAPKGSAFLWAAPRHRAQLHPTVISHGYGRGFTEEFGWTGTRDPSAWLSVPAAIGFLDRLDARRVRTYAIDLARRAGDLLAAAWGNEPRVPAELHGAMTIVPLPAAVQQSLGPATEERARHLRHQIWDRHRIEIPIMVIEGRYWARPSAFIYNETSDYERLAAAVSTL
jgi:isopenicillin-N epimerase